MPKPERRSDRWVAIVQSVLLHSVLVGALVFGWWRFRERPPPQPTLALNATVVSADALNGTHAVKRVHKPRLATGPAAHVPPPKPAPVPKVPPPKPVMTPVSKPAPLAQPAVDTRTPASTDEAARQAAAKQAAQAHAAQQAREQAQRRAEAAKRQAAAARQKQLAEARRKAEARRLAQQKREAQAKLAAERKRRAEAKRKAELARRAAEAKALALNQADLSASIAQEEKAMAARSGPALASWVQQITARIEHAWIRPPSAKQGIDCFVDVTQVPGGQIVNVKVGACNGDEAVVQSIQDAAYRASPLPPPPDPTLFERHLQIEFKPN